MTKRNKSSGVKDAWCAPIVMPNGTRISGGPAREHRVKMKGGMDNILKVNSMLTRQITIAQLKCPDDPRVQAILEMSFE